MSQPEAKPVHTGEIWVPYTRPSKAKRRIPKHIQPAGAAGPASQGDVASAAGPADAPVKKPKRSPARKRKPDGTASTPNAKAVATELPVIPLPHSQGLYGVPKPRDTALEFTLSRLGAVARSREYLTRLADDTARQVHAQRLGIDLGTESWTWVYDKWSSLSVDDRRILAYCSLVQVPLPSDDKSWDELRALMAPYLGTSSAAGASASSGSSATSNRLLLDAVLTPASSRSILHLATAQGIDANTVSDWLDLNTNKVAVTSEKTGKSRMVNKMDQRFFMAHLIHPDSRVAWPEIVLGPFIMKKDSNTEALYATDRTALTQRYGAEFNRILTDLCYTHRSPLLHMFAFYPYVGAAPAGLTNQGMTIKSNNRVTRGLLTFLDNLALLKFPSVTQDIISAAAMSYRWHFADWGETTRRHDLDMRDRLLFESQAKRLPTEEDVRARRFKERAANRDIGSDGSDIEEDDEDIIDKRDAFSFPFDTYWQAQRTRMMHQQAIDEPFSYNLLLSFLRASPVDPAVATTYQHIILSSKELTMPDPPGAGDNDIRVINIPMANPWHKFPRKCFRCPICDRLSWTFFHPEMEHEVLFCGGPLCELLGPCHPAFTEYLRSVFLVPVEDRFGIEASLGMHKEEWPAPLVHQHPLYATEAVSRNCARCRRHVKRGRMFVCRAPQCAHVKSAFCLECARLPRVGDDENAVATGAGPAGAAPRGERKIANTSLPAEDISDDELRMESRVRRRDRMHRVLDSDDEKDAEASTGAAKINAPDAVAPKGKPRKRLVATGSDSDESDDGGSDFDAIHVRAVADVQGGDDDIAERATVTHAVLRSVQFVCELPELDPKDPGLQYSTFELRLQGLGDIYTRHINLDERGVEEALREHGGGIKQRFATTIHVGARASRQQTLTTPSADSLLQRIADLEAKENAGVVREPLRRVAPQPEHVARQMEIDSAPDASAAQREVAHMEVELPHGGHGDLVLGGQPVVPPQSLDLDEAVRMEDAAELQLAREGQGLAARAMRSQLFLDESRREQKSVNLGKQEAVPIEDASSDATVWREPSLPRDALWLTEEHALVATLQKPLDEKFIAFRREFTRSACRFTAMIVLGRVRDEAVKQSHEARQLLPEVIQSYMTDVSYALDGDPRAQQVCDKLGVSLQDLMAIAMPKRRSLFKSVHKQWTNYWKLLSDNEVHALVLLRYARVREQENITREEFEALRAQNREYRQARDRLMGPQSEKRQELENAIAAIVRADTLQVEAENYRADAMQRIPESSTSPRRVLLGLLEVTGVLWKAADVDQLLSTWSAARRVVDFCVRDDVELDPGSAAPEGTECPAELELFRLAGLSDITLADATLLLHLGLHGLGFLYENGWKPGRPNGLTHAAPETLYHRFRDGLTNHGPDVWRDTNFSTWKYTLSQTRLARGKDGHEADNLEYGTSFWERASAAQRAEYIALYKVALPDLAIGEFKFTQEAGVAAWSELFKTRSIAAWTAWLREESDSPSSRAWKAFFRFVGIREAHSDAEEKLKDTAYGEALREARGLLPQRSDEELVAEGRRIYKEMDEAERAVVETWYAPQQAAAGPANAHKRVLYAHLAHDEREHAARRLARSAMDQRRNADMERTRRRNGQRMRLCVSFGGPGQPSSVVDISEPFDRRLVQNAEDAQWMVLEGMRQAAAASVAGPGAPPSDGDWYPKPRLSQQHVAPMTHLAVEVRIPKRLHEACRRALLMLQGKSDRLNRYALFHAAGLFPRDDDEARVFVASGAQAVMTYSYNQYRVYVTQRDGHDVLRRLSLIPGVSHDQLESAANVVRGAVARWASNIKEERRLGAAVDAAVPVPPVPGAESKAVADAEPVIPARARKVAHTRIPKHEEFNSWVEAYCADPLVMVERMRPETRHELVPVTGWMEFFWPLTITGKDPTAAMVILQAARTFMMSPDMIHPSYDGSEDKSLLQAMRIRNDVRKHMETFLRTPEADATALARELMERIEVTRQGFTEAALAERIRRGERLHNEPMPNLGPKDRMNWARCFAKANMEFLTQAYAPRESLTGAGPRIVNRVLGDESFDGDGEATTELVADDFASLALALMRVVPRRSVVHFLATTESQPQPDGVGWVDTLSMTKALRLLNAPPAEIFDWLDRNKEPRVARILNTMSSVHATLEGDLLGRLASAAVKYHQGVEASRRAALTELSYVHNSAVSHIADSVEYLRWLEHCSRTGRSLDVAERALQWAFRAPHDIPEEMWRGEERRVISVPYSLAQALLQWLEQAHPATEGLLRHSGERVKHKKGTTTTDAPRGRTLPLDVYLSYVSANHTPSVERVERALLHDGKGIPSRPVQSHPMAREAAASGRFFPVSSDSELRDVDTNDVTVHAATVEDVMPTSFVELSCTPEQSCVAIRYMDRLLELSPARWRAFRAALMIRAEFLQNRLLGSLTSRALVLWSDNPDQFIPHEAAEIYIQCVVDVLWSQVPAIANASARPVPVDDGAQPREDRQAEHKEPERHRATAATANRSKSSVICMRMLRLQWIPEMIEHATIPAPVGEPSSRRRLTAIASRAPQEQATVADPSRAQGVHPREAYAIYCAAWDTGVDLVNGVATFDRHDWSALGSVVRDRSAVHEAGTPEATAMDAVNAAKPVVPGSERLPYHQFLLRIIPDNDWPRLMEPRDAEWWKRLSDRLMLLDFARSTGLISGELSGVEAVTAIDSVWPKFQNQLKQVDADDSDYQRLRDANQQVEILESQLDAILRVEAGELVTDAYEDIDKITELERRWMNSEDVREPYRSERLRLKLAQARRRVAEASKPKPGAAQPASLPLPVAPELPPDASALAVLVPAYGPPNTDKLWHDVEHWWQHSIVSENRTYSDTAWTSAIAGEFNVFDINTLSDNSSRWVWMQRDMTYRDDPLGWGEGNDEQPPLPLEQIKDTSLDYKDQEWDILMRTLHVMEPVRRLTNAIHPDTGRPLRLFRLPASWLSALQRVLEELRPRLRDAMRELSRAMAQRFAAEERINAETVRNARGELSSRLYAAGEWMRSLIHTRKDASIIRCHTEEAEKQRQLFQSTVAKELQNETHLFSEVISLHGTLNAAWRDSADAIAREVDHVVFRRWGGKIGDEHEDKRPWDESMPTLRAVKDAFQLAVAQEEVTTDSRPLGEALTRLWNALIAPAHWPVDLHRMLNIPSHDASSGDLDAALAAIQTWRQAQDSTDLHPETAAVRDMLDSFSQPYRLTARNLERIRARYNAARSQSLASDERQRVVAAMEAVTGGDNAQRALDATGIKQALAIANSTAVGPELNTEEVPDGLACVARVGNAWFAVPEPAAVALKPWSFLVEPGTPGMLARLAAPPIDDLAAALWDGTRRYGSRPGLKTHIEEATFAIARSMLMSRIRSWSEGDRYIVEKEMETIHGRVVGSSARGRFEANLATQRDEGDSTLHITVDRSIRSRVVGGMSDEVDRQIGQLAMGPMGHIMARRAFLNGVDRNSEEHKTVQRLTQRDLIRHAGIQKLWNDPERQQKFVADARVALERTLFQYYEVEEGVERRRSLPAFKSRVFEQRVEHKMKQYADKRLAEARAGTAEAKGTDEKAAGDQQESDDRAVAEQEVNDRWKRRATMIEDLNRVAREELRAERKARLVGMDLKGAMQKEDKTRISDIYNFYVKQPNPPPGMTAWSPDKAMRKSQFTAHWATLKKQPRHVAQDWLAAAEEQFFGMRFDELHSIVPHTMLRQLTDITEGAERLRDIMAFVGLADTHVDPRSAHFAKVQHALRTVQDEWSRMRARQQLSRARSAVELRIEAVAPDPPAVSPVAGAATNTGGESHARPSRAQAPQPPEAQAPRPRRTLQPPSLPAYFEAFTM